MFVVVKYILYVYGYIINYKSKRIMIRDGLILRDYFEVRNEKGMFLVSL